MSISYQTMESLEACHLILHQLRENKRRAEATDI